MRNRLRWQAGLAAVALFLCWGTMVLRAQEITWVETRFHRVHLLNGNFIDGHVQGVSDTDIHLRLPVGEMMIRKNTIDRIELLKIRSILEKPKLDPPIKKSAPGKAPAPVLRAASAAAFEPAPASEELIQNVAAVLSRMKIAKPDQMDALVEQLAGLPQAGAYLASLLPTVEEQSGYMLRSALMRTKDPEAAPYLIRALDSDKLSVQINALTLLGILGNPDHARSIRPFLNDSVAAVKATAI